MGAADAEAVVESAARATARRPATMTGVKRILADWSSRGRELGRLEDIKCRVSKRETLQVELNECEVRRRW